MWNWGEALEGKGELKKAADLMQFYVDYERSVGHPDAEQDAQKVLLLRRQSEQNT